ncbi:hypothetical protein Lser_V15G21526 [Lactuca serriola]
MSIDEYTNAFTDKMEFALRIVLDEMAKIDRYAKGLPWEYAMPVHQTPTLEAAIWVSKSVEEMIKGITANKVEVGEKTKFEGSPRSDEKRKFSKSGSKKFEGGRDEARWCDKCKKKHLGRCGEEVTCFKCGKSGHYADECASSKKVCYECNEKGHISINCPKKKEPAKPKTFHMILDEADVNTRNQG